MPDLRSSVDNGKKRIEEWVHNQKDFLKEILDSQDLIINDYVANTVNSIYSEHVKLIQSIKMTISRKLDIKLTKTVPTREWKVVETFTEKGFWGSDTTKEKVLFEFSTKYFA